MGARVNINKRMLESLAVPAEKFTLTRDSRVDGLIVKVEPTGSRVFLWKRKGGGRLFYLTIGPVRDVTLDDARAKASDFNAALARWKQDGCVGSPPFVRPESMTLDEIVTAYRDRHVKAVPESGKKKAEHYAARIDSRMDKQVGSLRHRRLDQITKAELVSLHEAAGKKHGPYAANRVVELLRTAINWSINAGLYTGANLAAGIRSFPEQSRTRFLLAEELGRLAAALDSPDTSADLRDFVRLALFTGARKGDVMSMNWRDIDMNRCVWLVPHPKGARSYYVALSVEATKILKDRLAEADRRAQETGLEPSTWVFPSHSASGHVEDLKRGWAELLKTAGIENLRQHDLRRTLGSWQVAGGASLPVIGASLGHKSAGSTEVYARLQLDPVRASVAAATRAMTIAAKKHRPKPALPPAPKAKKRARA